MVQLKSLKHNGIRIIDIPHIGLKIHINGETIKLDPKQEQMAIAWARKLSTDYVEDPVFCKNFFEDFSKALGRPGLTDEEIDFSPIIDYLEKERKRKKNMSKEEKKAAREKRKKIREQYQEEYGYAELNGERVQIANYTAEPSCIFVGRGKHPLRGHWKEGPRQEDIILNHSPCDDMPEGNWKDIVWEPECIWVAKWQDKLSGKWKYVWLSDNTPIKQRREIEKFDQIKLVDENHKKIRSTIMKTIKSDDKEKQMIAAATYLIDKFNLRVGDEKDDDEADTVGATTLRTEHMEIDGDVLKLSFLGKDAVQWKKQAKLPKIVISVLKELLKEAEKREADKKQVFQIGSREVNDFLNSIVEGLTAKVFRTYHATTSVQEYLEEDDVEANNPDFEKKEAATMANLQAAIICNHMKQEP
ncbi:DNA topoisomerase I, partial [Candidatus Heimdallarchaeota archaeon]